MKKLFTVLLAAFVLAVVNPTKSEAKVMYDGAEVVKGQTGKMTFKKDIKVYKKNPNGTFDSLVVKRNNFFRTYDIEKYGGKTFYQMGQYRVQATDLVVFKEVPLKIRSSFYNNPSYIYINRNSMYGNALYGTWFIGSDPDNSITNNGQQLTFCGGTDVGTIECLHYPGIDLKIAETKVSEIGVPFELTKAADFKQSPIKESITIKTLKKGRILYSEGLEINGYLYVTWKSDDNNQYTFWMPVNLLNPVVDK
ncbi:hypothetical protein ACIQZG_24345 [Lysinibacillus sp. NPDC096418]|uniref:hypothetical protein n=1 Tax=Lysinibacillus sp. NPDC096418 TaxID=3364138 RepID=UPI003811B6ED